MCSKFETKVSLFSSLPVSKVDSINSARFYLVRAGRHPGGTASRGTAEERSTGVLKLRKHIAIVNTYLCLIR